MVNFAGMEFIFYFFPVFLLIYHLIPIKYKDVVLLLGSYLFYASGDLKYVLLLLLLTLCNYFMGQQIHKLSEGYKMLAKDREEKKACVHYQSGCHSASCFQDACGFRGQQPVSSWTQLLPV